MLPYGSLPDSGMSLCSRGIRAADMGGTPPPTVARSDGRMRTGLDIIGLQFRILVDSGMSGRVVSVLVGHARVFTSSRSSSGHVLLAIPGGAASHVEDPCKDFTARAHDRLARNSSYALAARAVHLVHRLMNGLASWRKRLASVMVFIETPPSGQCSRS